ncbi:hypothetical protein AA313_de0200185 [Arthrobotrys entomopaga]|nr:hypothetical protein AA313_de0200185 [Arthrobotrys entomopaga]
MEPVTCDNCEAHGAKSQFYYCAECQDHYCGDICWYEASPKHRREEHKPADREEIERLARFAKTFQVSPDELKNVYESNWFGARHNITKKHWNFIYTRALTEAAKKVKSPLDKYPSLVSFVGKSQSGKSTMIRALMLQTSLGDSILPLPGDEGLASSGTDEVHLFQDPQSMPDENPILFADCEGFGTGSTPQHAVGEGQQGHKFMATSGSTASRPSAMHFSNRLRKPRPEAQFGLTKDESSALAGKYEIKWATPEDDRQSFVEKLYPRLIYSFSDVVCYVTKDTV